MRVLINLPRDEFRALSTAVAFGSNGKLDVLGVAVLGVVVLGVAVLGVVVLGVAVLGVAVLGVVVLGFAVLGVVVLGFAGALVWPDGVDRCAGGALDDDGPTRRQDCCFHRGRREWQQCPRCARPQL